MPDELQVRKDRFLLAVTTYVDEAHSFLDYLDDEHPEVYLQHAHLFRAKLETALDALHALIRDNKMREAVAGYKELTSAIIEFTTGVAIEMKR